MAHKMAQTAALRQRVLVIILTIILAIILKRSVFHQRVARSGPEIGGGLLGALAEAVRPVINDWRHAQPDLILRFRIFRHKIIRPRVLKHWVFRRPPRRGRFLIHRQIMCLFGVFGNSTKAAGGLVKKLQHGRPIRRRRNTRFKTGGLA